MKKLITITAATAVLSFGYSVPAHAGPRERQIVQQCAFQGVQNEFQMQQCTGGLWVPKPVLDSCMTGGPCFDAMQHQAVPALGDGRFRDPSGPVWQPNAYQQDAMTCFASTGELMTGAVCSVGAVTARTLAACQNGIGVQGGCFGPNNTLVQVVTDPREAGRRFDRSIRKVRKRLFGF